LLQGPELTCQLDAKIAAETDILQNSQLISLFGRQFKGQTGSKTWSDRLRT